MKKTVSLGVILLWALFVLTGTAFAALTQNQVSQLYVGVFGRASEGDGNAYWQNNKNSTNITTAARFMLGAPAAISYFGDTLTDNQAFIEHIYFNTLGKTYAEDADGIDFWVGRLDAGQTKSQVIAALVAAAQNPLTAGPAQDRFVNKVTVSDYCAKRLAVFTDTATFAGFIDGVTDDPATVAAAKAMIDELANVLVKIETDGPPPDGNINHVIFYSYDADGNVSANEYDRDNDGLIDHVDSFAYDAAGNLIEKATDADNDGDVDTIVYYTNDAAGYLIQTRTDAGDDGDIDAIAYYTNNSAGKLVQFESDIDNDGDIDGVVYYSYDASDKPVKIESDTSNDGDVDGVVYYTYDVEGNITKYESDTDNDGDIDTEGVATYTYDAQKNIIEVFTDIDNDGDIDQKNYYSYE